MNKRRILIPGWSLGDNAWGVTKPYLHYFSQFGQVEILTPRKDVVNGDLLVLPGGADVNPHRYNQEPSFYTSNTDVFKQYFIDQNLEQYLGKMPIFGICLGMQQLNVFFGGSLQQHGDFEQSSSRGELIETIQGSTIAKFKVNSLHHQGIYKENLSPDFINIAESARYGNIEIIEHCHYRIIGVQYHPEEIYDSFSIKKINELLCVD